MASVPSYCLKWNNHIENVLNTMEDLFQTESLTDVTLAVADSPYTIKCHKMVLVACSSYFRDIILRNEEQQFGDHLIICLEGVSYDEIQTLLVFMYTGQVKVSGKNLQNIINIATRFQIKGLEMTENSGVCDKDSPADEDQSDAKHSAEQSSPMDVFNYNWNGPIFPTPNANSNLENHLHPGLAESFEDDSSAKSNRNSSLLDAATQELAKSSILKSVLGQHFTDALPQEKPSSRKRSRSENLGEANHDSCQDESVTRTEDESKIKKELDDRKSDYINPNKKWKRYKRYSQVNLDSALNDVKNGVQTLIAAQKNGVPSRTLYDKIKRLGIKKQRTSKRRSKKSDTELNISQLITASSACFPFGIGRNVDGSIYNSRVNYSESEDDNTSVTSTFNNTCSSNRSRSTESVQNLIQSSEKPEATSSCAARNEGDEISAEDLSVRRDGAAIPRIKEEVPRIKEENLNAD